MSTELAVRSDAGLSAPDTYFMPVVDVALAVQRRAAVQQFARQVMIDGLDYGAIPGAGERKVLLKPGAEKLASFFGLLPDFIVTHSVLDFDGSGEGRGEPLIYYRVRCDLYRSGVKVGAGDATCSSRESKYRWRNAARTCPKCGQPAIIKGKEEYGGGWLCFKNKGGCGAKYANGDAAIESQAVGRVPNPDIADADNTILKMAEKRALIAATLIATNVSDFFTQDMEDFVDAAPVAILPPQPVSPPPVFASPQAAIEWATGQGIENARDVLTSVKNQFGGRLTTANAAEVYAAFRLEVERMLSAAEFQPALVEATGSNLSAFK